SCIRRPSAGWEVERRIAVRCRTDMFMTLLRTNAEELTGCGARYGRDFWSRQEAPGQAFERGMPAVSLWGRTGQALYKMKRLPRPRPPSIRGSARTRCFHPPRGRPHMPPISFTVNGKRETVN